MVWTSFENRRGSNGNDGNKLDFHDVAGDGTPSEERQGGSGRARRRRFGGFTNASIGLTKCGRLTVTDHVSFSPFGVWKIKFVIVYTNNINGMHLKCITWNDVLWP